MNITKEKLEAVRDMLKNKLTVPDYTQSNDDTMWDAVAALEAMLAPDEAPVKEMVRKLDTRRQDTTGYITQTPEVISILSNLSPLVTWLIKDKGTEQGLIGIEFSAGIHLERKLL